MKNLNILVCECNTPEEGKIFQDAGIPTHTESLKESLAYYNKDLKTQFLILKKEPRIEFKFLADKYISNIHEIVAPNAKWLEGYSGLVQFICLLMISEKLKEV